MDVKISDTIPGGRASEAGVSPSAEDKQVPSKPLTRLIFSGFRRSGWACSLAAATGVKKTDTCLDTGLRRDRYARLDPATAAMPAKISAMGWRAKQGDEDLPRSPILVRPIPQLDRRVGDMLDEMNDDRTMGTRRPHDALRGRDRDR